MMRLETGSGPGRLASCVWACRPPGVEPVSLRYFRLEPDGSLHYLTADEIAAGAKTLARKLSRVWVSPDFAASFSNAELVFKPRGKDGPLRVHRHIAVNLSDEHLRADPATLKHLEAKG